MYKELIAVNFNVSVKAAVDLLPIAILSNLLSFIDVQYIHVELAQDIRDGSTTILGAVRENTDFVIIN